MISRVDTDIHAHLHMHTECLKEKMISHVDTHIHVHLHMHTGCLKEKMIVLFVLLIFKSFIYILDINLLLEVQLAKIFLHLFTPLRFSFGDSLCSL